MTTLYDRRGRGQDPLLGLNSEDAITGAAPRVLAHPGAHDSAVWEPYGLGLGPSQPEATLQDASRIAEAAYPDGPLASMKAP